MLKGQERPTGMAALKDSIGRSRLKRAEAASCVCNPAIPPSAIISLDEDSRTELILHFLDERAGIDQRYRCSREALRRNSPYFYALLDPVKFSEGIGVERQIQRYRDVQRITPDKLPTVIIRDVGELPDSDPHSVPALTLFLHVLHGGSLDNFRECRPHALTVLAIMAVLVESFDAVSFFTHANGVKHYAPRSVFEPVSKADTSKLQKESHTRQKLLAGMVFGDAEWVRQMSAVIICEGSVNWEVSFAQADDKGLNSDCETSAPLWWRLPHGMEEELLSRHEYVLATINSLQIHFLSLYLSKERQCKLGYDTSPQCDSFQLGEMLRFFQRKGLVYLQSTYIPSEQEVSGGDVSGLLHRLRQAPSYQLDRNHVHCGLRSRLLPLLDRIIPQLQVGLCLKCWFDSKNQESWLANPTGGAWMFSKVSVLRWRDCAQHRALKAMYTAEVRNWNFD